MLQVRSNGRPTLTCKAYVTGQIYRLVVVACQFTLLTLDINVVTLRANKPLGVRC